MAISKIGSNSLNSALTFTGQQTIPTINLTGGQITFPATAVPSSDANTLDDYEEGTWTPRITAASSGATGTSVSNLSASYTKIGRLVTVSCSFTIANKGSGGSGPFLVADLPFAANIVGGFMPFAYNLETLTASKTNPIGLIPHSAGYVYAYTLNFGTAGMTPIDYSEVNISSWVRFSLTYPT